MTVHRMETPESKCKLESQYQNSVALINVYKLLRLVVRVWMYTLDPLISMTDA